MRFLKALLCMVLVLLSVVVPTLGMVHADGDRTAGVGPGIHMQYYHEAYGTKSILDLTVTGVNSSSIIIYNWNETFQSGGVLNRVAWTDVNGAVVLVTTLTTASYDYTKVGTPHFFIGAGMFGGPEYKGSDAILTKSFFGKIILGNLRSTNYFSMSGHGVTIDNEWDQTTGILTKFTVDYNGAGDHYTLLNTNAWVTHIQFWDIMATIGGILSLVLSFTMPIVGAFLLFYFTSFFMLLIMNNVRVKKSRGIKHSFLPPWLKMIIIMTLVMISLFILIIYIIIPFILGLILR